LLIKLQFFSPEPYMVLPVKIHHKPPNYFSLYIQTSESSLSYWAPNYFELVQLRFSFEVLCNLILFNPDPRLLKLLNKTIRTDISMRFILI